MRVKITYYTLIFIINYNVSITVVTINLNLMSNISYIKYTGLSTIIS